MGFELFRVLDRDWALMVHSRHARTALARWQHEPAFAGFADLDDLIGVLRDPAVPAGTKDTVLAGLARLAPADDVAARTLLQAIVPGLVNVAKRLRAFGAERQAELVGEAFALVRTYPIERRPRAIAANLVWDTFSRLWRQGRARAVTADRETLTPDHLLVAGEEPGFASVEARDAITRAVSAGRVRPADVELLAGLAESGHRVVDRAQAEGMPAETLQKRVERARRRLAAALAPDEAVGRVA